MTDAAPAFAGLPDLPALVELKAIDHWVSRNTKKHPQNPHVRFGNASTADPRTWSSYEQAAAHAVKCGHPGVGFVLTNDFTGVDLDKQRPAPDAPWTKLAQAIIDLAETYTEVSPSGLGLRLFAKGAVPKAMKASPIGVEIYSTGRYLTVTGDHVPGTPTRINDAPKTLALLSEHYAAFRREREAAEAPSSGASVHAIGTDFFRNVNDLALKRLGDWVPSVFGTAAKYQPGTGAFRVSSRFLGRDLEEDLSIAPNGIRDWGVADMGDARGGARTAVTIVMDFLRMPSAKDAAMWLCERMQADPEALGWRTQQGDLEHGAALARALLRHKDGTVVDAETGEIVEEAGPLTLNPTLTVDLTIGGLGQAIADEAYRTARLPSVEFAFLPAVALLSVIFGRRFTTPTHSPLNLYLVGVGVSGSGKDHALTVATMLPHEAKFPTLLGPGDVTSDAAIEKVLRRSPCCLMPLDEVGIFLQGMSHRNSGGHERRVRKVLLELYSKGTRSWSGKESADPTKAIEDIWCPTLSLMGFSTPTELFEGFEERNLSDGFLARMVFIAVDGRPRRNASAPRFEASAGLVSRIRSALDWKPPGALPTIRQAGIRPPLASVPFADDAASAAFEDFCDWQTSVIDTDQSVDGYVNRASENAIRLATLRALSRAVPDLGTAAVTADDVAWAAAIIRRSLYTLDAGLKAYMAGSDFERAHKTAYAAVVKAGEAGLAESRLRSARGISKLDERTYAGVVNYLVTAGLVRVETPGKAGGRPGRRFFSTVEDAP